jgi:hypothetical protein
MFVHVYLRVVFTGVHVCTCVFAGIVSVKTIPTNTHVQTCTPVKTIPANTYVQTCTPHVCTCVFAGIVFSGVHVCTCVLAGIVFTGVHVCTCVLVGIVLAPGKKHEKTLTLKKKIPANTYVQTCTPVKKYPRIHMYKHVRL